MIPGLKHFSPLKDRIFRQCTESKESPVTHAATANRPLKYRSWSELNMREALNAVQEQGMTVAKASCLFGVPRTTLNDHKLGKVYPGARSGAQTMLSTCEELDLVEFLFDSANMGYPRTRKEVLGIVGSMLAHRGIDKAPSTGWWNKFVCRHPEVHLRTPATLSFARARASSRECIDHYFDTLEKTLNETGLVDHPALIFNMDESGFPIDPKPLKTIHCRGEKNPFSVSSGLKSQVTVVACVSACGQTIPPMIIWKRKSMYPEMANGEIPGTQYGFSEKGWMNSLLFHNWFKKQFLRYAPASRPLLLLLDGHSSHYHPDTIKAAIESGVIILALPPNTTHLTQPLDKGVFGPFKQHWRRVCHDFQVSHPGKVVNDFNFCQLFSKAWIESMTTMNIIAGFQTTGIYPVDREAIKLPTDPSSRTEQSTITPCATFTPFKRCPEDEMFGSCDIPAPDIEVPAVSKRPNALAGIVEMKTPVIKSKRVPAPAKILTSADFRPKENSKGTYMPGFISEGGGGGANSKINVAVYEEIYCCKMLLFNMSDLRGGGGQMLSP